MFPEEKDISISRKAKTIYAVVVILLVISASIFVMRLHRSHGAAVVQPVTTSSPVKASSTPVVQPPAKQAVVVEPTLPVGTDRFVVALADTNDIIAANLLSGGYITDASAFSAMLGNTVITPGGYKISKSMTEDQLMTVLAGKPYMVWVVIPPGLRKEEIAALLASALGWTKKETSDWITKDTTTDPDYVEGVYFPDTYLIPTSEAPADTANRLIAMFNEQFAPYLAQFNQQNIKWTTGLTLASIVQREAANDADMPLISGILWNRLEQGMPLDVDATIQYARGNTGSGWWAPISVADQSIDSPFNTYLNKGLPPHPIDSPGLSAIAAVLNPTVTDCLYYIHDSDHITHCATTLAEQDANIRQYLIDPASASSGQ